MSTTWTNPRHQGAGTWRHTAPHRQSITDLAVAFIACLLGLTLLAGLVAVGRHAMCATHDNALSYCSSYDATHDGAVQR